MDKLLKTVKTQVKRSPIDVAASMSKKGGAGTLDDAIRADVAESNAIAAAPVEEAGKTKKPKKETKSLSKSILEEHEAKLKAIEDAKRIRDRKEAAAAKVVSQLMAGQLDFDQLSGTHCFLIFRH